jgi:hypothetical protein
MSIPNEDKTRNRDVPVRYVTVYQRVVDDWVYHNIPPPIVGYTMFRQSQEDPRIKHN